MKIAAASLLYFAMVFGAGFVLGPVRVLVLEPRIGPLAAILCEAPFLLTAIVLAARWAPRAARVDPRRHALLLIGLGALALQQSADVSVGLLLRGMSLAEQFARLATTEGRIYLALLVLFAAMPLLVNRTAA